MGTRDTLLRRTEKYLAQHTITELSRATGIPTASLRRFMRGEGDLAMASIDGMLEVYGLEIVAKKKPVKRAKG